MQMLRRAFGMLGCVLLAGCSYHDLPRSHVRYYAGEVHNADLVLELMPSRTKPEIYWVRTAPLNVGDPKPGWEISLSQARQALRSTRHLLPLRFRPRYDFSTHQYRINLHYRNNYGGRCFTKFLVGSRLIPRGDTCRNFISVPGYTPLSGPGWRLRTASHFAFYPLSGITSLLNKEKNP